MGDLETGFLASWRSLLLTQLEQENAALQAEVAALGQRELAVQAQAKAAQDRAAQLATLNAALEAELLLYQQTQKALREHW